MKRFSFLIALVATLATAGCTESTRPQATGKAAIRAINAIKGSPPVLFLIEEDGLGSVEYKNSSQLTRYDDLSYTFNFEVLLPGATERTRFASRALDVVANKDYVFVVSGSVNTPAVTIWEGDDRRFEGTETVFGIRFGHAAESFGNVDIYFDAPGVAPAPGAQSATLAFGEVNASVDLDEGDYVMTVTAAGDPGNVVFQSATVPFGSQTDITITLFDGDENDVGALAVRSFNPLGGAARIPDSSSLPTIRFIQAGLDLPLADIYDDAALATPIVTDHAFGDATADIATPAGVRTITYTAAGDVGVPLLQNELSFVAGTRVDYFAVGQDGSFNAVPLGADRQSITTEARVTVFHGAANHDRIDIYVVDADEAIDEAIPRRPGVLFAARTSGISLVAGDYDVYVTAFGEETVLAGPFRISVALGDVLEALVVDTVDPATAEIRLLPAP